MANARWSTLPVAKGSYQVTKHDSTNDPAGPFDAGLEVLAAGTLSFVGVDGSVHSRTVDSSWLPYTLPVAVKRVNSTGTSIANADIAGLK